MMPESGLPPIHPTPVDSSHTFGSVQISQILLSTGSGLKTFLYLGSCLYISPSVVKAWPVAGTYSRGSCHDQRRRGSECEAARVKRRKEWKSQGKQDDGCFFFSPALTRINDRLRAVVYKHSTS